MAAACHGRPIRVNYANWRGADAGGYEVAWKMPAPDTTRSGRPTATVTSFDLTGGVSGTSTALENLETTFHQDLNGDGVIGVRRRNQQ